MSRAARLIAGATLVGACSSTEPPPVVVVHYGAPIPVDAAGAGGAGGTPSNDAAEDRSVHPAYGAPAIRPDAGG
jgi:hypothetical protein